MSSESLAKLGLLLPVTFLVAVEVSYFTGQWVLDPIWITGTESGGILKSGDFESSAGPAISVVLVATSTGTTSFTFV